jgi:amino acid transporter
MTWGWIITSALTLVVGYCLAEICGAYPSAGSVYYWAAQLSPIEDAPFWSYWTGLTNWLGYVIATSAFASGIATLLSGALQVSGYDAISSDVQVGVGISFLFIWAGLSCFRVDSVGWINNFGALVQGFTTLFILFCLFILTPQLNSADYVFFSYYNATGFTKNAYVVVISILFSLFGITGYESSSHVAEETQGAPREVAMSIVYTVIASAVGGFLIIMAFLFAMQDIADAIDSPYGSAALAIFVQALPTGYAVALSWLLPLNVFLGGVAGTTVASRMTYSLVRDAAVPNHETLSYIEPTLKTPVYSIFLNFLIAAMFQLLLLGNTTGTTAFDALIGSTLIVMQVSYAIPIGLKFYYADHPSVKFPITVMALPYSRYMGMVSVAWLLGTSTTFFFPTVYPITASSMNYSCVIVALIVAFGIVNWELNSKFHFRGPPRHHLTVSTTATDGTDYDDDVVGTASPKPVVGEELSEESPLLKG